MMELSVWAPHASTVEVLVSGDVQKLTRDEFGYWHGRLWPGVDYLLSVDGGPGRPDPRSRWQPHGVHGPTRAFDVSAYSWGDDGWPGTDALGKVLYEIHVGTFTTRGTLDSAIERLPLLADLGVDLVELMPLSAFPGDRGWGYDGVAPFSVHDVYGGPAALQRFVDAAHGYGLGVVLDVVYNHLGPSGNYLAQFAPYFTEKHETPWGWAVNFDQEHNDQVRRFFVDTALTWFTDFHIDALRLDAIQTLVDDSDYRFLAQLSDEVAGCAERLGRPLRIMGETDTNSLRHITPTAEGGDGLDGIWSDDFHHALHAYLTGDDFGYYQDFTDPKSFVTVLENTVWWDGRFSPFRGGEWGQPVPAGIDRRRFVACTQNHDQVGNRALGDRPEASIEQGAAAAAAAFLLLSPNTALLFQGQEWGAMTPFQYFTDHDDELGKAVTEGRKAEFAAFDWASRVAQEDIPDPQDVQTFLRSKLDWNELRTPGHRRLWKWYQALIALRRHTFGDGSGDQEVVAEVGDGWVSMMRGPLTVVATPKGDQVWLPVTGETVASFGGAGFAFDDKGTEQFQLGPYAVAILRS